jgi:hypothetical protein
VEVVAVVEHGGHADNARRQGGGSSDGGLVQVVATAAWSMLRFRVCGGGDDEKLRWYLYL